ncbi:MAG TPA: beta-ketoacyl-[acyl-carrier-protein] synthase II [Candidatus Omnitrophota bacterium]|nr:beta-ketoacyl-[acyl-carrier-protein] synthase II [Candidatus Omnitrophota bacterium]HQB94332.1 beta-ketoacyl-[acyl-carrier-protein] synthase II [Candidatus Omnitrophota bacterium]
MSKRRIVVTGVGAVTPLGNNVRDTWLRVTQGKSGIGPITLFDASTFNTRIAGEVKNFNFERWLERNPPLASATRSTFFALQAAAEAYKDAMLKPFSVDSRRFGLYFGAGDSGIDFEPFIKTLMASFGPGAELVDKGKYLHHAPEHMSALRELESQPFMTVTHLTRLFDIRGPVSNCLTACAASSQAIGEAYEWIKRGDADVMMSGGSHSMVYPLGIAGFSLLTALSTRNSEPEKASRPFDKKRDGFVISEGAGVLIIEELQHAKKRKAHIYGEVVGYGSTADSYRLTDMDPEARGASEAMRIAMTKAGIGPADVDYINAHGTSTSVNDSLETTVIKKVMGEYAKKIPVSSTKSMLGHMIAAAGGVEAIFCLLAMRDSIIPPTINYEEPDPELDLDYVPNVARRTDVNVALSNSFGFGGQNICLALRRYDGA